MSFISIELTDEQVASAASALAAKGVTSRCVACGKSEMSVLPLLSRVDGGLRNGVSVGAATVLTACQNCGLTLSFVLKSLNLDFDNAWEPTIITDLSEERPING